jgi:hypothetical protein
LELNRGTQGGPVTDIRSQLAEDYKIELLEHFLSLLTLT